MVFKMKEGGWLRNANLTQSQGKIFEGYDSIKSCLKEPFQCPTAVKGHKTQSSSKKRDNEPILWLVYEEPGAESGV